MKFTELGLIEPVLRAVQDAGYETPSPIQAQTIPHTMQGHDIMGCAQTGTGKTAAFALPVLHRLSSPDRDKTSRAPRHAPLCLILAPTRELAIQIEESFTEYGKHVASQCVVIFGGVNQSKQVRQIKAGVDILVATPGRLMDLHGQGLVDLGHVNTFILDEADRMLDMGFIHDIKKITAQIPKKRQTLMFSATMPKAIEKLARELLHKPTKIEAERVSSTAAKIEQLLYYVDKPKKTEVLAHLLNTMPVTRAIVFSRTKHGADRIVRQLKKYSVEATAIHGNKSQNQRQRSLSLFKENKIHVLVATDIAARGIDIDEVSHVFNYDVTHEPETYVHRIGRTGRAGQSGVAVSLCMDDEIDNLKGIEKLIGQRLQKMKDLPDHLKPSASATAETTSGGNRSNQNPRQQGRNKQGSRGGQGGQAAGARPKKKRSTRRGNAQAGSGENSRAQTPKKSRKNATNPGSGRGPNPSDGASGGPGRKRSRRRKPGDGTAK